jgi:tetratricopeptide (TPR) repeat protein
MKNTILISLTLLIAAFALISIRKYKSSSKDGSSEKKELSQEKKDILKFWEHVRQANEFRTQERWQPAMEHYEAALKLNNRHEDALYYAGNMSIMLGRNKAAEKYLLKLVEINDHSARAFLQLGNLYLHFKDMFDIKKAEKAFLSALEINKEESGPLIHLGQVYLVQGDLTRASDYLNMATKLNYKNVDAYFLKGYVNWKQQNQTAASENFALAVKYSKPEEAPVKAVKEDTLFSEGDTKSGKAMQVDTNFSSFTQFMQDLKSITDGQLRNEMNLRYKNLDAMLNIVRKSLK